MVFVLLQSKLFGSNLERFTDRGVLVRPMEKSFEE